MQASMSKSLHLLQIDTCSKDELETFNFSILAFKSTFAFLRLEIEAWHEDNSKESNYFFLHD
jgi:hypothetical protein